MPTIDMDVKGLRETQRKLEQIAADLHGKPMLEAMRDCTLLVANDAKRLAPVDMGGTRASITPTVRAHGNEVQGVVGSNLMRAAYMELGTRPHWPPIDALRVWARRHGISAYLVARAIARHGTKPRRFLQGALENNQGRIKEKLGNAVGKIVKR